MEQDEITHEQVMEYYEQAKFLIFNGYPVSITDVYELAKQIASTKVNTEKSS